MNMQQPRVNLFTCRKCKKSTVTVDVNLGKTPVAIVCPECDDIAESTFYPSFNRPQLILVLTKIIYEFYRPDILDATNMRQLDEGELLIRKRTEARSVTHAMYQEYIEALNGWKGPFDYATYKSIEIQIMSLSIFKEKHKNKRLAKKFNTKASDK